MRKTGTALFGLVLVFVVSLGAPATGRGGDLDDNAQGFITSLAEEAVSALTDATKPKKERTERFKKLLREHFAIDTIARWVLGKYWRAATPDEKKEYLDLFEELIIKTYVDRFADYQGEQLKVTKAVTKGSNYAYVYSQIVRPTGGKPLNVGWWVREGSGQFKIIDVTVEGISMSKTQRSEFATFIRQNGGAVGALLDELRRRLKDNA